MEYQVEEKQRERERDREREKEAEIFYLHMLYMKKRNISSLSPFDTLLQFLYILVTWSAYNSYNYSCLSVADKQCTFLFYRKEAIIFFSLLAHMEFVGEPGADPGGGRAGLPLPSLQKERERERERERRKIREREKGEKGKKEDKEEKKRGKEGDGGGVERALPPLLSKNKREERKGKKR